MGRIGQYTGSKRRQSKRMAPLRERCGKAALGTSATGVTTARKASASNFIQRATSMKACGPWIRSMDRAPIGGMKVAS